MAVDSSPDALFPSLDELKRTHEQLLEQHHADRIEGALQTEVGGFLARARATGAALDARADRRAAQSIIDFWATRLYRAGDEPLTARLAPFDPELAPELPDEPEPYVGLGPFVEEQSGIFYGRDEIVQEVVAHLRASRVVALVGASGSGKSSLARAGVIPALRAGALPGSASWHYLPTLVPGPLPLENLARILTPPASARPTAVARTLAHRLAHEPARVNELVQGLAPGPAVLLVDQFEETFTLCHDGAHRHAFITALLHFALHRAAPRRLILTMRSDFVDSVARVDVLRRLFNRNRKEIRAMGHDELRLAIVGPAQRVGLKFGDGVVDDLVKKHVGGIATLPLLQFTLRRLWRGRYRNRVSWEQYQALGGARNALQVAADAFYENLSHEEQRTFRRVLLRMSRPAEGLETTSSRMPRSEIEGMGEDPGRIARVLDGAIAEGLIHQTVDRATGEPYIEVAHEALLRNWPILSRWIEEDRELNRRRYSLEDAALRWTLAARRGDLLWSGLRLKEALAMPDPRGTLSKTARDFLRAGLIAELEAEAKERQRQEQEEKAREAEREAARQRAEAERLRLQLEAEQQRAEAEQRRAEAERLRLQLEAEKELTTAREREGRLLRRNARLLGIAALLATLIGLGALASLFQIADARGEAETAREQADAARQIAEVAATTALAGQDMAATQASRAQYGQQTVVIQLQTAEVANATATVVRRDLDAALEQAAVLAAIVEQQQQVNLVGTATSVSISQSSRVDRVLERARGELARGNGPLALRLAVYAAGLDQSPQVEDVLQAAIQAVAPPLRPATTGLTSAGWDRTGRYLLVLSDNFGHVFDPDTGRPLLPRPLNHNSRVMAGAWASGSEQIATLDEEGTVRVWDVTDDLATPLGDAAALPTPEGRNRVVHVRYLPSRGGGGVAWSPDDGRLLAAAGDLLYVWPPPGTEGPMAAGGAGATIHRSAWSPSGASFVTAGASASIRRGDSLVQAGQGLGQARSAAWSPAGTHIVAGGDDRTVRIWRLEREEVAGAPDERAGHSGPITSVSWSPSGRSIVSASEDGTARIWIVGSPELRYVLHGHNGPVLSAAWSPDSRRIVTAGSDGTVRLFYVQFGDILAQAQDFAGAPLEERDVDAILASP